ncbi:ABC transporter ATP-binding protein [uncultured Fusobacterium sp.]|jgi:iron(III) transport system ATP-binding protein|uniref:ABC transporter ATP-binding protein n=1 Tax=uncultured Fusobacterium sp. TaxID=159267 RepID=UPI0015A61BA8|nr:ABC transporter ATP-binding protein [uncultured Fusobacterium sp.]
MIKFSDVQISYGDYVAVDNLNLEINEGEFFTMLGPSGCGKTTTLRCLVGFSYPTRGKIFIGDVDVTKTPTEKRGVSIVFQSYALFPTMNVYENIAFGLTLQKLPKEYIDKKVREAAEKVQIVPEKLFNNVSELSGGQQQRVAIARALVLNPKILCLDEPLSNLDAKLRVELRNELKKLQNELKITTIYVTHDQEEALTLSDRIAVFNKGKIEQVGTPEEIYTKSKSPFVCEFIGEINKIESDEIKKIGLDKNFNQNTPLYFRLENLSLEKISENDIEMKAKVIDVEYTGIFSKITYDVNGVKVRNIEKNNGKKLPKLNEDVCLYLSLENVMQFGDNNEQ